MLTGGNATIVAAIARATGVRRVVAEVLPEHKASEIQRLQAEGRKVGMVGAGINDAPALAAADVGLAIGTGTGVAVEAADIVLISGSLAGVVTAIALSRPPCATSARACSSPSPTTASASRSPPECFTRSSASGCPRSSPLPRWRCRPYQCQ